MSYILTELDTHILHGCRSANSVDARVTQLRKSSQSDGCLLVAVVPLLPAWDRTSYDCSGLSFLQKTVWCTSQHDTWSTRIRLIARLVYKSIRRNCQGSVGLELILCVGRARDAQGCQVDDTVASSYWNSRTHRTDSPDDASVCGRGFCSTRRHCTVHRGISLIRGFSGRAGNACLGSKTHRTFFNTTTHAVGRGYPVSTTSYFLVESVETS